MFVWFGEGGGRRGGGGRSEGWGIGGEERWGPTASMAFLTCSDRMRPLLVRFLIKAAFVEPVDIHAMVSWSCKVVEDVIGSNVEAEE